jgi:hypothetical protein
MTIFVTTSTAAMVPAMLIFPVTKKLMMNVSMLAAIRQLTAFAKERRVSLSALEQIHLSSTRRLNGAALVGILGQEARRGRPACKYVWR